MTNKSAPSSTSPSAIFTCSRYNGDTLEHQPLCETDTIPVRAKRPMERTTDQTSTQETSTWTWPLDDRTPVDVTDYYVSKYHKKGLSYWIGAARLVGNTAEE